MKLLLVAANYPYLGCPFSGVFSERSAEALRGLGQEVTVLAPRPFAPPIISSLTSRWRSYAEIPPYETRNGIFVMRPAYPQFPRLAGALTFEVGGYYFSRRLIADMHRQIGFEAVLAFEVLSGGLAWRFGEDLGVPAAAWASGGDVRVRLSSFAGRAARRTLRRLDAVFYQSHELMEEAAGLLQTTPDRMPTDRHIVLPRGIPQPPLLLRDELRRRVRADLGVAEGDILVLTIGRITRDKGIFELLDAMSRVVARNPNIKAVLVGSLPALDETAVVQSLLSRSEGVRHNVKLLAACEPSKVWEYLCASDMFVFPSHQEGMPNSLLEAMAMGVPAIAFSIPPVLEVDAGKGALLTVPLLDASALSEAILRLAGSPGERIALGERGRARVMDDFMVVKNMGKAMERIIQARKKRRDRLAGDAIAATRVSDL